MDAPITDRLAQLRHWMKANRLNAFIIPSTDAHISEYPPAYWNSREWISGFTGSAGTVVVTETEAGLWTDSRYFIQAAQQLAGSGIGLFKDRLPDTPRIVDWIAEQLDDNDRVGIDGNVFAASEAMALHTEFEARQIKLVTDLDPFATLRPDRPPLPTTPIELFDVARSGEATHSKIARILAAARQKGGNAVWISSLDTVAWLFNLRGADVPYNPVAVAHAFVSATDTILFINREKVPATASAALEAEGVRIADYHTALEFIGTTCNLGICIDRNKLSYTIYQALVARNWEIHTLSVADLLKSVKNETEQAGFRQAMRHDGVAMVRFLRWLEGAVRNGEALNEYEVGVRLNEYRAAHPHFRGDSFSTIAGYGPNGAIVHYKAALESAASLKPEGLLLIDSGGQYIDGTTDITRTVALGALTEAMKRDYTLVLKGNIALDRAVFPAGTRGAQLDVLARSAMWREGINYMHGTGHGVGHYLNVHEGPQSIRMEENPVALAPGMVVTNEPGIYRAGQYGIRIENILLVQPESTTNFGQFYRFETLTLCPIDTAPIDLALMTPDEIEWLNNYHATVFDALSPLLDTDEREWLAMKTKPISAHC